MLATRALTTLRWSMTTTGTGARAAAIHTARNAYPNYTHRVPPTPIDAFVAQHAASPPAPGSRLPSADGTPSYLAGRIVARRDASSKLVFLTLRNAAASVQVVLSKAAFTGGDGDLVNGTAITAWDRARDGLRVGDHALFAGTPGATNTGALSLFAHAADPLAPVAAAAAPIPFKSAPTDPETLARNRTLALLVHPAATARLATRAKLMRTLRTVMTDRAFLEVDTPILAPQAGGAAARPFITHSLALDGLPLALRVAPELFLKRLVVAGFDRVFELGRQFRNEGIDASHNPEFTTCEAYMAYAGLGDVSKLSEDVVWALARDAAADPARADWEGGRRVPVYFGAGSKAAPVLINFEPPYRVIDVVPFLEAKLGEPLPSDLETDDAAKQLEELMHKHKIAMPGRPHTTVRLLDALISELVEPECIQPTFVRGHPRIMSPLAKSVAGKPEIAARFELFAAGKELINAYEELNDPQEQRERFKQQQRDRDQGDAEAQPPDEDYCRDLELGLPPTAGWGLGVDRLVMMLTGASHIRDVIAFPTVKPNNNICSHKDSEKSSPSDKVEKQ
ncbi:hypothetical protein BC828DRAFT_376873 [Blastocladiella britannica]|nr:hypothetical protein BC828DRAFT_376873 [Blastocladiella britannica]